jgi:Ca2+-binding EF-hand superfamily protein
VDYAGAVDEDMVAPTRRQPTFAQRASGDYARVPNPPPKQASAANPRSAAAAVKPNGGKVVDLLRGFKSKLAERGPMGLIGLQRRFRIMDDDGSQSLNKNEFTKAIKELKVGLSDSDIGLLFAYFDRDNSGNVEYNEFLYALRGELNDRRRALVHLAFKILDKDGSGVLEPADVIQIYDTSKHPEVLSKRKTKEQVMREFLDSFDVGGEVDGKVTLNEFENYYSNLGASIDSDDYFELMIRNAWRISGGVGMAANTANTRVLVTRADGTQGVEEIKNDLGLRAKDKDGMVARLRAQGSNAVSVDYAGAVDEPQTNAGQLAIAVAKAPSSSLLARLNSKVNPASASPVRVKPAPAILSKKPAQPELTPEEIALAGPKLRSNPSFAQAINPSTASINTKKKITTAILTNQSHALAPPPGVTLIIDKIKYELKNRDAHGYTGLVRMFKSLDTDSNSTLNLVELKNGLKSIEITIDDVDVRQLFIYFDKDGSGSIDLNEFIDGLREPVSERRMYIINCAFNKLDTKKQSSISADYLASSYDATRHPEVMARRMTTNDALLNFMETFDVSNDGYVSKEEFQNYYINVSQAIENDEYFELLLRNTWHIDPREKVPSSLKVETVENNNILHGIKELGSPTRAEELASVDSQILETVQQEVKQYRMDAIAKFNSKQYDRAQKLFESMLNSLLLIYPENHPDVLKAKKSIAACNRANQ